MTKEQELRSLLIRKRTFLIVGIILVCLIIVPVVVISIHATQYFLEVIQDTSPEDFLAHYFEYIYRYFEGNLWTLGFTSFVGALCDIGIVFIVLAFALFGRKAKKVQRELLSEKIQKEESSEE